MQFATWLTERAAERGLSLPQVARKISVAAPTVQAWARGARAPTKIAHVRAIARWTGATEAAVLAAILAPDHATADDRAARGDR